MARMIILSILATLLLGCEEKNTDQSQQTELSTTENRQTKDVNVATDSNGKYWFIDSEGNHFCRWV